TALPYTSRSSIRRLSAPLTRGELAPPSTPQEIAVISIDGSAMALAAGRGYAARLNGSHRRHGDHRGRARPVLVDDVLPHPPAALRAQGRALGRSSHAHREADRVRLRAEAHAGEAGARRRDGAHL